MSRRRTKAFSSGDLISTSVDTLRRNCLKDTMIRVAGQGGEKKANILATLAIHIQAHVGPSRDKAPVTPQSGVDFGL